MFFLPEQTSACLGFQTRSAFLIAMAESSRNFTFPFAATEKQAPSQPKKDVTSYGQKNQFNELILMCCQNYA